MIGNIGNIFTIALRALNHRNEIEKVLSRIPSTQQQINELTRFANDIVGLVDKIAPGTFGSQQTTTQQTLDVRWLQTSLNRLDNAGLAVDGDYGPLTKQAVTNFQRQHGLTADGWAGVQTQAKIFELLG